VQANTEPHGVTATTVWARYSVHVKTAVQHADNIFTTVTLTATVTATALATATATAAATSTATATAIVNCYHTQLC
jgi:hypothetical protein